MGNATDCSYFRKRRPKKKAVAQKTPRKKAKKISAAKGRTTSAMLEIALVLRDYLSRDSCGMQFVGRTDKVIKQLRQRSA